MPPVRSPFMKIWTKYTLAPAPPQITKSIFRTLLSLGPILPGLPLWGRIFQFSIRMGRGPYRYSFPFLNLHHRNRRPYVDSTIVKFYRPIKGSLIQSFDGLSNFFRIKRIGLLNSKLKNQTRFCTACPCAIYLIAVFFFHDSEIVFGRSEHLSAVRQRGGPGSVIDDIFGSISKSFEAVYSC